jgi:hypothetical protein
MSRITFALALFCASPALAASLPVYTAADQGSNRQLILENFDVFGGTQAGVIHSTTSPAGIDPTWQALDAGGDATFYLRHFGGAIVLRLSPLEDRTLTGVANLGFMLPSAGDWAALRDLSGPLTFRINGYTEEITGANTGRWRISTTGSANGQTANANYAINWRVPFEGVPEPHSLALLLVALPILVRRR